MFPMRSQTRRRQCTASAIITAIVTITLTACREPAAPPTTPTPTPPMPHANDASSNYNPASHDAPPRQPAN